MTTTRAWFCRLTIRLLLSKSREDGVYTESKGPEALPEQLAASMWQIGHR
jgi:hypothetical protein